MSEEKALSKEESKIFKGVMLKELTQCTSDLLVLEDAIAGEDFQLLTPDYYTMYQRLFISFFMKMVHGVGTDEEAANDDGSGDSEVQT